MLQTNSLIIGGFYLVTFTLFYGSPSFHIYTYEVCMLIPLTLSLHWTHILSVFSHLLSKTHSLFLKTLKLASKLHLTCVLLTWWYVLHKNRADWDAFYVSKVWWFVSYFDSSGSFWKIRTIIIKVGSKSRLLTCSSNITLSLPSYTVSVCREN